MRWLVFTSALVALFGAATSFRVPSLRAIDYLAAGEDVVAQAELRLADSLTSTRLSEELARALAVGDTDLAESLVAVASEHGIAPDAVHLQELNRLRATSIGRSVHDFATAFVSGEGDSGAALSGALAADMTGFGDLRDLVSEGRKAVTGKQVDRLNVALAAAGLGLTAATVSSLGATMPARGGLTMVKSLRRAGALTKPLVVSLQRTAASAFDREALERVMSAASRLRLTEARRAAATVVSPHAGAELRAIGEYTSKIYAHLGSRGTRQVLALAESPADIRRAATLAASKGKQSRGILALLGRSALIVSELTLAVVGWLFAVAGWLFAAALFAAKLGRMLGRLLWPRKRSLRAYMQLGPRHDSVIPGRHEPQVQAHWAAPLPR